MFYLDVVTYSVMSNHYHVVLLIDQEAMKAADAKEIVSEWHQIHKGNLVSGKFLNGELLERHEIDQLNVHVHKDNGVRSQILIEQSNLLI